MNAIKCIRKFKSFFWLTWEQFLDGYRYFSANSVLKNHSDNDARALLESNIIKTYHVIEKCLSMPEFEAVRATERVQLLQDLLRQWIALTGEPADKLSGQAGVAHAVLAEYTRVHGALDKNVTGIIDTCFRTSPNNQTGGTEPPPAIAPEYADYFRTIAHTRKSIRSFSQEQPSPQLIEQCIIDAMQSPSVCNRQSCRVHRYTGPSVQRILRHQNGNKGFGHTVPCLMIITSDLRAFSGSGERYQGWIDGGMFSMSLLLSLHASGLGAVALNWSVSNKVDRAIRKAASLQNYERIIMLIGIGIPAPHSKSPKSTRKRLEEILLNHE
jgi:nitroreductase